MSMRSWLAEFYPVPASADMSDLEAIRHGLRKWEGHQAENVARHGLRFDEKESSQQFVIKDEEGEFEFGINECSLCLKHLDAGCEGCPIDLSDRSCNTEGSAYEKAIEHGDTQAMIDALKLAERCVLERNGEADAAQS